MPGLDGVNIARNIFGHGLTAAALTAGGCLKSHIDGWFGRHPAASFATGRATAVLWHVLPVVAAVVLLAAFIIPKTDGHTYGGQVHGSVRYSHDDPYHLLWPSRVVGVIIVLAVGYVWGDAIVDGLKAWIG